MFFSRKEEYFLLCLLKGSKTTLMTCFGCPKRRGGSGNVLPLFFQNYTLLVDHFSSRHLVSKLPCRFSCRAFQTSTWGTYGCAVEKDSSTSDGGFTLCLKTFDAKLQLTLSMFAPGVFISRINGKTSDTCSSGFREAFTVFQNI